MSETLKQQKDLDKTHNTNLRCISFVWAKCQRPNASTTIAREQFPEMSCHREILSLPIVESVGTAQDLENIGVGPTCETVNNPWCWCSRYM